MALSGAFATITFLLVVDAEYPFFRLNNESEKQNGRTASPGINSNIKLGTQNVSAVYPGTRLQNESLTKNGVTSTPGISSNTESVAQNGRTTIPVIRLDKVSVRKNNGAGKDYVNEAGR